MNLEDKKRTPEGVLNRQIDCTPSRKKTQAELLLDAWGRGEEVSNADALLKYSIGHLASVISDMRLRQGIHGIRIIPRVSENGRNYTAYYMPR